MHGSLVFQVRPCDVVRPVIAPKKPEKSSHDQGVVLGYQDIYKGGSAIEAVLPLVET